MVDRIKTSRISCGLKASACSEEKSKTEACSSFGSRVNLANVFVMYYNHSVLDAGGIGGMISLFSRSSSSSPDWCTAQEMRLIRIQMIDVLFITISQPPTN